MTETIPFLLPKKLKKNVHTEEKEKLVKEFENLNNSCACPTDYEEIITLYPSAIKPNNFQKNRYNNVLPNERTRVVLSLKDGKNDTDYINANYIEVEQSKYISCQAPLPSTIEDFWRMVWEQKSPLICMLTRLQESNKVKATRYWPEEKDKPVRFGSLQITLKDAKQVPFIDIRTFRIFNFDNGESREITQLHYTEWPDFGVPQTSEKIRELINLSQLYLEAGKKRDLNGPLISHCSAGIGRSGAFITLLVCFEKIRAGEAIQNINIKDIITSIRKQRSGMVQTDSQYLFIHQVLRDLWKEFLQTRKKSIVFQSNRMKCGKKSNFLSISLDSCYSDIESPPPKRITVIP